MIDQQLMQDQMIYSKKIFDQSKHINLMDLHNKPSVMFQEFYFDENPDAYTQPKESNKGMINNSEVLSSICKSISIVQNDNPDHSIKNNTISLKNNNLYVSAQKSHTKETFFC